MFKEKVSAVKSLMVAGKLLILLTSTSVYADINNPRFFEYRGGPPLGEFINFSFGWFRTLDNNQKEAYYQSINHALMYAENGQSVEWYRNDASGWSKPVMTWPTGSGYCRRLYIQAIAYNTEKIMTQTACFNNASGKWSWIRE